MKNLLAKYADIYNISKTVSPLPDDDSDPFGAIVSQGFIELYEQCWALVVPADRCPNCGYVSGQYIELHCQHCGCGLARVGRDETTSDTLPAALEAVRKVAEKLEHDLRINGEATSSASSDSSSDALSGARIGSEAAQGGER